MYERLGASVSVATVKWASDQVLRRLLPEGSEPQWRNPSGQVRLIQVGANDGWVGMRITAVEQALGARVPFLTRFGQGVVPNESTILQDGDMLYHRLEERGRAPHRGPARPTARQDLRGTPHACRHRRGRQRRPFHRA